MELDKIKHFRIVIERDGNNESVMEQNHIGYI